MIRAKDVVVLGVMLWFLLKDKEETNVALTQTCIDSQGNLITVPLGDCPEGYTLLTGEVETENGGGLGNCECIQAPCDC